MNPDTPLNIQSVCVYCGSSSHVDEAYKQTAVDVGTALAKHKLRVVYGGGHVGLMGLLADSALAAGGEVVGIIPEHIRAREVQHIGLTDLIVVSSMHARKSMMVERADAFVVLPGGFGTLDETFEILTWKQLGLHNKPIIIYNQGGFWTPLLGLIDHITSTGFAPHSTKDHAQFYTVANNLAELFTALALPREPMMDPATKWF